MIEHLVNHGFLHNNFPRINTRLGFLADCHMIRVVNSTLGKIRTCFKGFLIKGGSRGGRLCCICDFMKKPCTYFLATDIDQKTMDPFSAGTLILRHFIIV